MENKEYKITTEASHILHKIAEYDVVYFAVMRPLSDRLHMTLGLACHSVERRIGADSWGSET